jgi:hypothetical protein
MNAGLCRLLAKLQNVLPISFVWLLLFLLSFIYLCLCQLQQVSEIIFLLNRWGLLNADEGCGNPSWKTLKNYAHACGFEIFMKVKVLDADSYC